MSASHYQACIAAVRAASGRNDIDEAELERIFTRAQNRTRWYQQQGMDSLAPPSEPVPSWAAKSAWPPRSNARAIW